jgi:3-methylcrotonyl-CoA carboxylase alpha subunit
LELDGEVTPLDIETQPGDNFAMVRFGETPVRVDYESIDEGRWRLVVNGRAANVFVTRTEGGKQVFINGRTYLVKDADAVTRRRGRGGGLDDGPGEVTPPMPAVVVRILVTEGDRVTKGQGLIVVSAMKMESTLAAPYDGTVTRINAAVEAKVMPGDILVEIEPEDENE